MGSTGVWFCQALWTTLSTGSTPVVGSTSFILGFSIASWSPESRACSANSHRHSLKTHMERHVWPRMGIESKQKTNWRDTLMMISIKKCWCEDHVWVVLRRWWSLHQMSVCFPRISSCISRCWLDYIRYPARFVSINSLLLWATFTFHFVFVARAYPTKKQTNLMGKLKFSAFSPWNCPHFSHLQSYSDWKHSQGSQGTRMALAPNLALDQPHSFWEPSWCRTAGRFWFRGDFIETSCLTKIIKNCKFISRFTLSKMDLTVNSLLWYLAMNEYVIYAKWPSFPPSFCRSPSAWSPVFGENMWKPLASNSNWQHGIQPVNWLRYMSIMYMYIQHVNTTIWSDRFSISNNGCDWRI